MCTVTGCEKIPIADFKWLEAERISYTNNGQRFVWESVVRTTRAGGSDGVAVLALVHGRRIPDSVVLVSQFRPPLGRCCLELPAGLADGLEAPEATALRELKEETGFTGTPSEVSPIIVGEPGMTNNSLQLVTVHVDIDAKENIDAEPQPEETEGEVERHLIPIQSFQAELIRLAEGKGFAIDSRLFAVAVGMNIKSREGSAAPGVGKTFPVMAARRQKPMAFKMLPTQTDTCKCHEEGQAAPRMTKLFSLCSRDLFTHNVMFGLLASSAAFGLGWLAASVQAHHR